MMRRAIALTMSGLAALAIAAAGAGADVASKRTVDLGDNFFDPDKLSISSGTKVAFNWVGDKKHNVTKKRGPGGGFASETTRSNGVNYTKKFKKAGTYKLICTVHEKMKMRVEVG
jgi:plastocyanin